MLLNEFSFPFNLIYSAITPSICNLIIITLLCELLLNIFFSRRAEYLGLFQMEELNNGQGGAIKKIDLNGKSILSNKEAQDDPIDIQRREKVKEAMLHAWKSYETYAWGQDELQVCWIPVYIINLIPMSNDNLMVVFPCEHVLHQYFLLQSYKSVFFPCSSYQRKRN